MTKPSESIRLIWQEMKEMKRLREQGAKSYEDNYLYLEDKYENIETLFGREETLLKAIIFYLDQTYDK